MASSPLPDVGARFGSLTFVALSSERKNRQAIWIMACDCGNSRGFLAANVKRGNSTSCCGNGKRQNLLGKTFGRLTVVSRQHDSNGRVQWRCECECGGETVSYTNSLNSGHTQSCGCLQRESAVSAFVDISGQRFGLLVAKVKSPDTDGSGAKWECLCDCGRRKTVLGSRLRTGIIISCGCAAGAAKRIRPAHVADKYNAHANSRRALQRGAGGKFTPQQIMDLYSKQRGRCAWCPTSLKRGLHRDHRTSLKRGGNNDIRNIELLCPPCNLKKNAMDEIEWARRNGRLL